MNTGSMIQEGTGTEDTTTGNPTHKEREGFMRTTHISRLLVSWLPPIPHKDRYRQKAHWLKASDRGANLQILYLQEKNVRLAPHPGRAANMAWRRLLLNDRH